MKITYYIARRIIFTAFISVSLIALGAAISAVSALDKYSELINKMENFTTKSVSAPAEENQSFIVRAHNGIIGVFNANGELEYSLEVYIKTLPEVDRLLLERGIFAKDNIELLKILEDYDA